MSLKDWARDYLLAATETTIFDCKDDEFASWLDEEATQLGARLAEAVQAFMSHEAAPPPDSYESGQWIGGEDA